MASSKRQNFLGYVKGTLVGVSNLPIMVSDIRGIHETPNRHLASERIDTTFRSLDLDPDISMY